jgi:hypothetical protein
MANYYCPERQTKQSDGRISLRLVLTSDWPEAAGVVGIVWKMYFDSPILGSHHRRLRGVLRGGPAGS